MARASLIYGNMQEGGGLVDNVDVRVVESNACMYDYNGKSASVPALHWKIEDLETGDLYDQYWGAGSKSTTEWAPSADGKYFESIGGAVEIYKSSNLGMLSKSFQDSGFPKEILDGDMSKLVGVECHMDRISAYRKGLESTKDATVLVVTKLISAPGEKTKTKSKTRSKSNGKSSTTTTTEPATQSTDSDDEVRELATEQVMNCLMEKGGELTKATIVVAVQKALKGNPMLQKVINLIFKGDLLETGEAWTYNNGKVSME